jgi:hypothetical protein
MALNWFRDEDKSVGTSTKWHSWAGQPRHQGLTPNRSKKLSLLHNVQISSDYNDSFPGCKAGTQNIRYGDSFHFLGRGTLHCATSRKVAGRYLTGPLKIFHELNTSSRIMVLGSTQHVTEASKRSSPRDECCRYAVLTTLSPSCAEYLKLLEPSEGVSSWANSGNAVSISATEEGRRPSRLCLINFLHFPVTTYCWLYIFDIWIKLT